MKVPATLLVNNLTINTTVSMKLPDHLKHIPFKINTPLILETEVDLTVPMPGVASVYLIKGDGNNYKIGFGNPLQRLRSLQTGNPYPLQLIACCPGGKALENKLHDKYKNNKIQGEWFNLTDDDVNFIKKIMAIKYFKSKYSEDTSYWDEIQDDNDNTDHVILHQTEDNSPRKELPNVAPHKIIRENSQRKESPDARTNKIIKDNSSKKKSADTVPNKGKTFIRKIEDLTREEILEDVSIVKNIVDDKYPFKTLNNLLCKLKQINEDNDYLPTAVYSQHNCLRRNVMLYLCNEYTVSQLRELLIRCNIKIPNCDIIKNDAISMVNCFYAIRNLESDCNCEELKASMRVFGLPISGGKDKLLERFKSRVDCN